MRGVSTKPSLTANGAMAAEMLPQLPAKSTRGSATSTWANRKATSALLPGGGGPTMAALLSEEIPPPSPSICRPSGSGLPSAARMIASTCSDR